MTACVLFPYLPGKGPSGCEVFPPDPAPSARGNQGEVRR